MKKQFLLLLWMTLLPMAGWAADLIVTPSVIQKTYGDDDPVVTTSMFAFSGTSAQKTALINYMTIKRVQNGENVGSYSYTFTINSSYKDNAAFTDDDVFLAGTNGTLNIAKAPLTLTAADASKTYGAADPVFALKNEPEYKNGDDATSIGLTITRAEGENATTYTITPAATSENYVYTINVGEFTINKAELTLTAAAKSKTFGEADPEFTLANEPAYVNGDNATSIGLSFSRADGTDVGTYAITPAATSTNYNYTINNANLTIIAKSIAGVTIADIANQPYTGNNIEPALTVTDGGSLLVAGNDYTVAYSDDRIAAGTEVTVTITGKGNYDALTTKTTSFNIVKKTLTVTADDKNKNYGEDDPALTFSYDGFVAGEGENDLTSEPTISRASGETPGNYTITVSGGEADNYAFSYVNGTFTINAAGITITAADKSKTYGDADPELTYTLSDPELAQYITTLPTLTRVEGNNVGTYAITASGAVAAEGYTITYVAGTLTINEKTVTVTADNKTKVKGQDDPELTYTVTGLVGNDVLSTIPVLTRAAGDTPGEYAITFATDAAASTNYTINQVPGTFTITKPVLIIRAQNVEKTYGDADPDLTAAYTVSGLVGGDALTTEPTLTRVAGENAGTYDITATGAVQADYDITYFPGTFTINKKALTITANDASKSFGEADPAAFTVTYGAFAGGEDENDLTGTLSVVREEGEAVGTYAITPSGLTSDNYAITFVNGTFTINATGITITAEAKSKTYGAEDPEFTYTVTPADAAQYITTAPTLTRVEGDNVGTYAITANGAVAAAGYNITYVGNTLTINAKDLTITADNKSKTLYAVDPELTYTVDGLVGDDVLTTEPTLTRVAGETLGTYAITATGADAGANYNINYVAGEFTITKPQITITVADKTKTYGADDPAFTYTVTGLQGSDHLTTEPTLVREAGANVGTYAITASGAVQDNYDIEYVAGTLTINKAAAPTITALDQVITYGNAADLTPSDATISIVGLQNGETVADNSLTITLSLTEGAATTLGEHANAILVTATSDNYEDAAYVAGKLTVNAPAGLNFTSIDTDYDDIVANNGKAINVTLKLNRPTQNLGGERKWVAGEWNTLVLPFDITVADLSKVLGYAIVNVINDVDLSGASPVFKFKMTMKGGNGSDDVLKANRPFVLKTADDLDIDKLFDFGTRTIVAPTAEDDVQVGTSNIYFKGTYQTKHVTSADNGYLWFLMGNYHKGWAYIMSTSAASWDIVPFAGYIDMSAQGLDPLAAKQSIFIIEDFDGSTTAIKGIDMEHTNNTISAEGWYNMNGTKMQNAPTKKGIYIQNGKKVVIK